MRRKAHTTRAHCDNSRGSICARKAARPGHLTRRVAAILSKSARRCLRASLLRSTRSTHPSGHRYGARDSRGRLRALERRSLGRPSRGPGPFAASVLASPLHSRSNLSARRLAHLTHQRCCGARLSRELYSHGKACFFYAFSPESTLPSDEHKASVFTDESTDITDGHGEHVWRLT